MQQNWNNFFFHPKTLIKFLLAYIVWGLLMSIQHSFYPVEAEKKGATPSQVQKYLPRMLFRIYYVINLFRPSDPYKTFSFKESRVKNQGFWSLLTACSLVFKVKSDLEMPFNFRISRQLSWQHIEQKMICFITSFKLICTLETCPVSFP